MTVNNDVSEMLEALLGNIANEGYEGWESYWDDESAFRSRIEAILEEWLTFVTEHADGGR